MGRYINPGNEYFSASTNRIPFVDKTELILELNHLIGPDGYGRVCISRPRRFGKTMAANMLSAYYCATCDSRELFQNLKIAQTLGWDNWLNKCNVLKIDLGGFCGYTEDSWDAIERMNATVVADMSKAFPKAGVTEGMAIDEAMAHIYDFDHKPFVVIIDEYDSLVRVNAPQKTSRQYLDLLNRLFKNDAMARVVQLAYFTGILPVVRDWFESKLNNFKQYTMLSPKNLGRFIGFTKDEVKQVCDQAGIDYATCLDWYDGYKLNDQVDVASPYSVAEASRDREFESYWSATGTYQKLKKYIEMDFDGLRGDAIRLVKGEHISVKVKDFSNVPSDVHSKDDVFTYLIHLGYLAYNNQTRLAYVPNREVMGEWESAIENNPKFTPIIDFMEASRKVLEATIARDAKTVADALDYAHEILTSNVSYNNEQSLQTAILLTYYYAREEYTIVAEMPAGRGVADLAFIPMSPSPARPAIIVELKWNQSTKVALAQICNKRYANALRNYKGNIIRAAITYNPKSKEHECEFDEQVI